MVQHCIRSTLLAALLACAIPAGAQAAGQLTLRHPSAAFAKRYHPGGARSAPMHVDTSRDIRFDLAGAVRTQSQASLAPATLASGSAYLPTTWCGTERTTDDAADSTLLGDEPYYKLVYAYASDQTDRFAQWQNALQGDVSLIGQFMAAQDGGTKSPRFDMGTSCGPQYVDIQVVALPSPRASYIDNFAAINSAVDAALGASTQGKRNIVTLADGLTAYGAGSFYGLGATYAPSTDTATNNPHSNGNLHAMLFPPQNYNPPTSSAQSSWYPGFWPEGMLHEITHTLGAVGLNAPHTTMNGTTPYGHCTDGYDVMCYNDGTTVPYTTTSCPQISGSGGLVQTYDCGGDDYFNPSPAAGTYLATHWNTYNSVFEGTCPALGYACGASTTTTPAGLSSPRVTGTAKVANTLTADRGTWSGTPTSYAYQWQRDTGAGYTPIASASSSTYALQAADASASVRVQVTATNSNGSGTNTSAASAVPAYNPPASTVAPSVAGTARRTSVLTATTGTWTNSPTSKSYQWQRQVSGTWSAIASATGSTYTLVAADVGNSVRVVQTATNADGSATANSNAIGAIAAATPINSAAPSISGTPKPGRTLTATTGTWSDTPTSYGYQWQRDAGSGFADVGGATAATYVVDPTDVGAPVRVLVTAANADGTSAAVPSASAGPVAALAPPVAQGSPSIAGIARDGNVLTATGTSWSNSPSTTTFQWQSGDCASSWIDLAARTASTLTIVPAYYGQCLRVIEKATNADGTTQASSNTLGPAVAATPVDSLAPSISGTTKRGHVLTADPGTWSDSPTSYAYQWERSGASGYATIAGATTAQYTPVVADTGHTLRVQVKAHNADGDSAPASSAPSAAIDPAPPANTQAPAIIGAVKRGQVLTADPGQWAESPTSFDYQWQARPNGGSFTDISGAQSATFTPGAPEVGDDLRVVVVAHNVDGASSPAYATGVGPVADLQPPVNTGDPSLTGTAKKGRTLVTSDGTWSPAASSFAYQWQRETSGSWSDIPGATAAAYDLVTGDVGHTIRATVVAHNADGDSPAAASAATLAVADAVVPVNSAPPTVSGTARRGVQLSADPGTWSANPGSFAYQWQRASGAGFADVGGATGQAYTPVAADVGSALRVRVIAGNGDGASAPAFSDPTAAVVDAPAATTAPFVTGTPQRDSTLAATQGAWTGSPLGYALQWQLESGGGWLDITGATASTYALPAAAVGSRVRARVTATNALGDGTALSNVVGPVSDLPAPPAEQQPPPAVTPPDTTPQAVVTPPHPVLTSVLIALKNGRKTMLKLPVAVAVSPSGVTATIAPKKVRLTTGTYKLKLCDGTACATKRFTSVRGKAKLPAMKVHAAMAGRITVVLTGRGARSRGAAR